MSLVKIALIKCQIWFENIMIKNMEGIAIVK